jgi:hypothetical protein
MYPHNFNAANAPFDQQNRNANANAYGNVAAPQANYNFDGSGPQLNMQIGNGNADGNIASNPQTLLFQAYQQVHQAIAGQQEAITRYHDLVVKHEAQVSVLKDQIDNLKDELSKARADAETSRLPATRYVISYSSSERPFH